MKVRIPTERGVGLYEAAVWLIALLPIALVGTSIVAMIHDQSHLSGVPQAVLRESSITGLRWMPDGAGGRFEADLGKLRAEVAMVGRRALSEAQAGMLKGGAVSAKACFWIFSVHPSTGKLETPIWSECDVRGPLGAELSLVEEIERERTVTRGIVVGEQFIERVVVAGVVVAAQSERLLDPNRPYRFSKGAIVFARQEVEL